MYRREVEGSRKPYKKVFLAVRGYRGAGEK